MTTQIPKSIIDAIGSNTTFLAHAHLGPDPDSVGSILALKLGLEQIGKTVFLFCEDDLPPSVLFLASSQDIEKIDIVSALTYSFDSYIALDTAAWKLVTHHKPFPIISKPIINIDHHPDNNIKANWSWIDPKASAVCEMTYVLLKTLGVDITADIATALLLGILHDTDKFQNRNTNATTLKLCAELIKLGGRYQYCITELARSLNLKQLKAFAFLLGKLKLSEDKKFIYVSVNYEQFQALNVKEELGSFANAFLGRVAQTDFGALLVEKQPGIVKGYLRSRNDFDVSLIAHQIGGGGHQAASGFRLEKTLALAEQEFLSAVASLKKKTKS